MSVHWGGKGPGHVSRWPKAVGPVNTYSGATMLLDFLNPVLDPRIAFSRGTNATLIDSTGKLTYAPNNLVVRSEEFDSTAWGKTVGTFGGTIPVVTPNVAEAPDGTMTADRAQFATGGTTNSDDLSTLVQIPAGAGTPALFSVWVKSNTTSDQLLLLRSGSTFTTITATSSWQRFSALQSTPVTSYPVNIGLRGSVTGTVSSADVLLWGAQLEAVTYQTTPSTYVATTASAYYGPRFNYDPVTLAPRGLLIEEARTNLLTYSEQFDNAAWTKSSATITANAATSPDGTINADLLAADGTLNQHYVQISPAVNTSVHTYTVFAKRNTANFIHLLVTIANTYAQFSLADGSLVFSGLGLSTSLSATSTNLGNGWYRFSMTFAYVGTPTFRIYPLAASNNIAGPSETSTASMSIYGAQLEAGSFATSYIPTVASTVTRSADVATMTGTNFSSWYNQSEGTMIVGYSRIQTTDTFGMVWEIKPTSASSSDRINVSVSNVADPRFQVFVGGVSQLDTTTTFGTLPVGSGVNAALAYKSGDNAAVRNGSAPSTSASTFAAPSYTNLQIGGTDNAIFGPAASGYLNGHIRQIAYYNTRLPNAQLQTLTAPSLATTLSLDFTSGSYNVGF